MSTFGFTFKSLYCLEVDELWDIARLVKGDDHYLPKNKDVLIRGVIIPFLREFSKTPKDANHEQVMRSSLVKTAQILSIEHENWDLASNSWLVLQIRRKWSEAFRKSLENLNDDEFQSVIKEAGENLKKRAKQMGIGLLPAAGVVAGKLSGFGIYLATTTGLGAISSAIGVVFPWAMYQGATTALGVILGPIGWAITGAGAVASGIALVNQWLKRNDSKMAAVVIATIVAIGDNPYEWFGLEDTAPFKEVTQAYQAMMKTFHPDLLPNHLPDWVIHRFNEFLLQTQENYQKIRKYQPGEVP